MAKKKATKGKGGTKAAVQKKPAATTTKPAAAKEFNAAAKEFNAEDVYRKVRRLLEDEISVEQFGEEGWTDRALEVIEDVRIVLKERLAEIEEENEEEAQKADGDDSDDGTHIIDPDASGDHYHEPSDDDAD